MSADALYGRNERGVYVPNIEKMGTTPQTLFKGPNVSQYEKILNRSIGRRFLLVNAHPDDEFPAAGLIQRLRGEYGMTPEMALFTMGEGGEDARTSRVLSTGEMSKLRQQELEKAAHVAGIDRIHYFNQPDGGLKPTLDLAQGLARVIREVKPAAMVIPSGDHREHPDHLAAFELSNMARAIAALPVELEGSKNPHRVPLLIEGEVMNINPERFGHIVDVTGQAAAIEKHRLAYGSQVGGSKRYEVFFIAKRLYDGNRLGEVGKTGEAFRVSNGAFKPEEVLPKGYHPNGAVHSPRLLRV